MQTDVEDLLAKVRDFAMPHGGVENRGVAIAQEGEMRLAPGRKWMRFKALQVFDSSGIAFRWNARFTAGPAWMNVVDTFWGGKGSTAIRLFGFLPIGGATGDEIDKGAAMRGLAEIAWHPAAIDDGRIAWQIADDMVLRARFDDGKTIATVYFNVADDGRILGGSAPDRPYSQGNTSVPRAWSGRYFDYESFGSLRMPSKAEVTWHLPEGDFLYFRCEVTSATLR
jgi:hypothetical protein